MALSDNLNPKDISLNTDLYELTMAQAYFDAGMCENQAVFTSFFRDYPFGNAYCVCAGTGQIPQLIEDFCYPKDALDYLASLRSSADTPLFSDAFLSYLATFRPRVTIDAVLEGDLVFSREPLFCVEGPLIACQLLETALLNLVNFQTLVATKCARVVYAANGRPVSDFGLRRAQGPDGALSVARASWIGGAASTSNVLAGKVYGIPVFGTHAHSWVMSFASQADAFRAFALSSPNNCVFLLDTYDVKSGIADAIQVAKEMREKGEELQGVRIDSGDLAKLSKYVRAELDKKGFENVKISVSNDLDELTIQSLLSQGAPIDSFGVGTKLATADPNPSLGGVYKLSAVELNGAKKGELTPVMKTSEMALKRTVPGRQRIARFVDETGTLQGDVIYDPSLCSAQEAYMGEDLVDAKTHYNFKGFEVKDVLACIVKDGRPQITPSLEEARQRCMGALASLDASSKRFLNPQTYPVALDERTSRVRDELLNKTH